MKAIMKAAVVLGLGTWIQTQTASAFTPEEYTTAQNMFAGGDDTRYFEEFSTRILSGIEGKGLIADWPADQVLKYAEDFQHGYVFGCQKNAFTFSDVSGYGFTSTRTYAPDRVLVTKYILMKGNVFSFSADPYQKLKALNVKIDESQSESGRRSVIASASGITTILRPFNDILVFQNNYSAPKVFLKCQ